jgi:hypothetical protein
MAKRLTDLEFMQNDMAWPQLFLPLLRSVGDVRETGYLMNPVPVVRIGNIFAVKVTDEVREYDSFEAIIADGWRVD